MQDMKNRRKPDRTLESKFEAYYLIKAGFSAIEIAKMLRKNRATIYYRVYLIEGWLRTYKGIRDQYRDFLSRKTGARSHAA